MPIATHTKAAEQCTSAAQAHKSAADLHGKGEHAAALEKATKAQGHCDEAKKSSAEAHGKSTTKAKM